MLFSQSQSITFRSTDKMHALEQAIITFHYKPTAYAKLFMTKRRTDKLTTETKTERTRFGGPLVPVTALTGAEEKQST